MCKTRNILFVLAVGIVLLGGALLALFARVRNLERKLYLLTGGLETEFGELVELYKKPYLETLEIMESILKINPTLDSSEAFVLATAIYKFSKDENVPWRNVVFVIEKESSFRWNAISRKGCIGLMQINPEVWCKVFGVDKMELFNPITNLRLGTKILREYLDRYRTFEVAFRRYQGYVD